MTIEMPKNSRPKGLKYTKVSLHPELQPKVYSFYAPKGIEKDFKNFASNVIKELTEELKERIKNQEVNDKIT